jgi:hypothetical protein
MLFIVTDGAVVDTVKGSIVVAAILFAVSVLPTESVSNFLLSFILGAACATPVSDRPVSIMQTDTASAKNCLFFVMLHLPFSQPATFMR